MDAVLDKLIEQGGLIALLLVLVFFTAKRLYADIQAAQAARVTDAQGVVTKILDLVEKSEASKQVLVKAIDENTDATRSLASDLKTDMVAVRAELADIKRVIA